MKKQPTNKFLDADNVVRCAACGTQTFNSLCPVCDEPDAGSKHDTVDRIITEQAKVYGDPQESIANIGQAWTALLQQHYGIRLDHPLPGFLVALMLTSFKLQRSTRVYKDDNYIDAQAYLRFAEEGQKKQQGGA